MENSLQSKHANGSLHTSTQDLCPAKPDLSALLEVVGPPLLRHLPLVSAYTLTRTTCALHTACAALFTPQQQRLWLSSQVCGRWAVTTVGQRASPNSRSSRQCDSGNRQSVGQSISQSVSQAVSLAVRLCCASSHSSMLFGIYSSRLMSQLRRQLPSLGTAVWCEHSRDTRQLHAPATDLPRSGAMTHNC